MNKINNLTPPMWGRGSSTHRVFLCVCVSDTALVGTPGTRWA